MMRIFSSLSGCLLTCLVMTMPVRAVQVADLSRDDVTITVDAEPGAVDLGRDFFVTLKIIAPKGRTIACPDLRDRFSGFRVAEDFTEDPVTDAEGRTTIVSRWRLVPEVAARRYRLAPIAFDTFCTAPVVFEAPAARAPVTGDIEIAPTRDLPPLSWKIVGWIALALIVLAGVVCALWLVLRKIREMVRVHRMSPIQRAFYELEKLLAKGLPGRGFYKDFYVELTMVVRRYIERQHGVEAPHLTTDEFLRAAEASPAFSRAALADLKRFLESADLVKFAGVEATPEMADAATGSARTYLTTDNQVGGK